jgi:hypothetical protein
MKLVIYLTALVLFAIGCNKYTEQTAFKQVNKAIVHHEDQTLNQFRLKWPVTPTASITDSTEYKKYLADLRELQAKYENQEPPAAERDTIIDVWEDSTKIRKLKSMVAERDARLKANNAYISELLEKCKEAPAIRDTIKERDDAEVAACLVIQGELKESNKDLQKKVKSKITWLYVFAGLAVLGWLLAIFVIVIMNKRYNANKAK